jgi:hypothetical protein
MHVAPANLSDTFLLSPAYCSGRRATMLLREESTLEIASRLGTGALTLGEAFAFLSGLYFRGKLTYATAFTRAAQGHTAGEVLVITPTRGLLSPDTLVTAALLQEFAGVDLHPDDPRYRAPLVRDAEALRDRLPAGARVVLLGSIASDKYVSVLSAVFGRRLHYPADFIGRGDMSRGGLLLRSAGAGTPLGCVVLDPAAPRRGTRPPKLTPLRAS